VAESLATAMLVATVVGSGIMAERLAGGQGAIALLANMVATGAILVALLLTFGPISGAHLNPVVTLGEVWLGRLARGQDTSPRRCWVRLPGFSWPTGCSACPCWTRPTMRGPGSRPS
jgi:glycerol uptake facilitator-like aquaporin